MTTEAIEQASRAFEEAADLTPQEAHDLAREYRTLCQARDRYDDEAAKANKALRAWVAKHGPIFVEGIGELELVNVRRGHTWDLNALYEAHPDAFYRLLELHALTVNDKVLEPFIAEGQFTGEALREPFRGDKETPTLRWKKATR
jgi:hypothetical protein